MKSKNQVMASYLFILASFFMSHVNGEVISYDNYFKVRKNPLIITHASTRFDRNKIAKNGIDRLIDKALSENQEIYFLFKSEDNIWYPELKSPTKKIKSIQGEHNLISDSGEFAVAGGYLGSDEN